MKEFSSKLALNEALLKKDDAIKDGEVVVVKTFHTGFGDREVRYLLKKCNKCGELFFQSEKCKYVYVLCDACARVKKMVVKPNGQN